MDWNTIVILSAVGTFFACVGIFAFAERLERRNAARAIVGAPPAAVAAEVLALSEGSDEPVQLASDSLDVGDACELENDARLGLPPGWTEMFGCWNGSADDTQYQRIGDHRH